MNCNYIFSGTLSQNSGTYIERQADRELYQRLSDLQFCFVFNSRKMGKSSLRVRVMSRLQQAGFACATLDLSLDDVHSATPEKWYFGIAHNLVKNLSLDLHLKDLVTWWSSHPQLSPLAKLRQFLETVLLKQSDRNIVIFIDEIDSVLSLSFPTDDFFAFIRGCYNSRADNPDYNRLSFCLLGVATPSGLIADKHRTPFNIGHSIELTGFNLAEAQSLASGLVNVDHPHQVLAEIITWTGGQPFLTQKLCHLVANCSSPNPEVAELVRECIIENWEYQDEPEHLRTIRDRLLYNPRQSGKLLSTYLKILRRENINLKDSPEVRQLKLSGVIVTRHNRISVFNPIYEAVFNQEWVATQLATLRPYTEQLSAWLNSDCAEAHLLNQQELHDAQLWAADKSLAVQDYQFLNASLDYERKKAQQEAQDILTRAKQQARRQKIVGIIFSLVALIAGGWATWQILNLRSQRYADLQRRISLGEDILLNPNLDKRAGAKQFAQGNFTVAAQSFQRSRQELPQDPETLIYQNNARLINLNPVTIAVSVPIGKNKAVAQQMLRGVAQAQQEVNQDCKPAQLIVSCGIRGRPLQIKIVNDDNDPEIARELAAVLIKDSSILAVVGHNASDVSRPAAKIYQHRLVMISPTSFSVDFREITSSQDNYRDNYIFRTIPGIKHNVQSLVKHIAQSVNQPKILICYDSEADDNHSFKKEFSKFAHKIDMVDLDCDLSNPNLDYQQIINQGIQHQANSLLLAPHVDRINEAIKIAKINYQRGEQKLRLFSSPSLYTSQTLEDELGREAVIGMQMAVAWHPEAKIDRNFREQAQKLWKTNLNYKIVTWRTAMSYDATQAIVQGLSKQSHFTRSILQKALSEPEFSFSGATGLVQFEHGERIEKNALLVEIQSSNNSETDADFVLLAN